MSEMDEVVDLALVPLDDGCDDGSGGNGVGIEDCGMLVLLDHVCNRNQRRA